MTESGNQILWSELMGEQSTSEISLVSQYDDLCWYTTILSTGSEEKFKFCVENILSCNDSESEVRILNEKKWRLEADNKRLKMQIKLFKDLFVAETVKRKKIEQEKESMGRQEEFMRNVLCTCSIDLQTKKKLSFLCRSIPKSPPDLLNDAFIICDTRNTYANTDHALYKESSGFLSSSDVDEDFEYDVRRRRVRRSIGKCRNSEDRISLKSKRTCKIKPSVDNIPENCNLSCKAGSNRTRSNSEPTAKSLDMPIVKQLHRSET